MKITITKDQNDFISLQFNPDTTFAEFKTLCQIETNISLDDLIFLHDGKIIKYKDEDQLSKHSIKDGDIIVIRDKKLVTQANSNILPLIDFSSIQLPSSSKSSLLPSISKSSNTLKSSQQKQLESLKAHFLNNPNELSLLKQKNPAIVDALMNNDLAKFNKLVQTFMQGLQGGSSASMPQGLDMARLNEDLLNPDMQEKIANFIQQKNIDANMETALEHTPESFGHVSMLFIDIKLNDVPVKAFVDTGAQSTLMSQSCAERCNLLRLVDKRWSGIAKGVGTQTILGRIHLTQMVIENVYIACSFSVLENQPMDVLLGLDILKRYQCIIDLQNNLLKITTYNVSTRFLHENELPAYAQHQNMKLTEQEYNLLREEHLKNNSNNSNNENNNGTFNANNLDEAAIKNLVEMGFSRDLVIEELTRCQGNVAHAAHNLTKHSL